MILSNSSSKAGNSSSDLDKKSIVTLGDTLSARGFLLAAHFCYLVAQVEFGSYSNKASKLVLLSSSVNLKSNNFLSGPWSSNDDGSFFESSSFFLAHPK